MGCFVIFFFFILLNSIYIFLIYFSLNKNHFIYIKVVNNSFRIYLNEKYLKLYVNKSYGGEKL